MSSLGTHLVLIPAYNPGPLLLQTVREALGAWDAVWVVVDGSTDRSHEPLVGQALPGLRVIVRPANGGKGAAVLTGATEALAAGYTHALVMDADGQHPADHIATFMAVSRDRPGAVVCGKPSFGPEAPMARLQGRKLSIGLVRLETGGRGAADPLFGFRVYPLARLVAALKATGGGRGYDFDPEMAVRLAWAGVPAVNVDAPCRYIDREKGGVSHFNYLRDNLLMVAMHTRLIATRLFRGGNPPAP